MKAPSVKFDPTAIGMFFLAHGEKIAVAIVSVVALLLAWGGVQAVRGRSVTTDRRPDVIVQEATRAEAHMVKDKAVPEAMVVATTSLATDLEPWRSPKIEAPPTLALLDRPLFDAESKRSQPDILPVEDLMVSTGLVVLPQRMVPGADGGFPGTAESPQFPGAPEQPAAETPGRRGRNLRKPPQQTSESTLPPGSPDMGMMMAGQALPGKVKVVPYAIVMGLIPARKQFEEYRRRFGTATFQDPRRDTPLWSDYEIDRSVVAPDGTDDWAPLDLSKVAAAQMAEWTGVAQDLVPPLFMLGADEAVLNRAATPFPFCGPLPQRMDGAWGDEVVHPWIVRTAQEMMEQQRAAAVPATNAPQGQGPIDVFQGAGGGFGPGGYGSPGGSMMPPPGMMSGPGMMSDPGMMSGSGMMDGGMGMAANAMAKRPENRLFRFVDTTVEPGKRYRYRVRLKVWNPNWSPNPEQMRPHVADFSITKEQRIGSPDSAVSSIARVPETTSLLLAMLPDTERKRLKIKPGTFEILVKATTEKTGDFTLRSVLSDIGGFANVDSRLNKTGDVRSRGDDVTTGLLLLDAVGEQGDSAEGPAAKRAKSPPEPFEMLFTRDDGTFELVSAADSQPSFVRYRQTLPDGEDTRRGPAAQQTPGSPYGSPAMISSPFGQVSP